MILDQTVYFENPEMPEWLEMALKLSFKQKNLDNINGYSKLWEDMLNAR